MRRLVAIVRKEILHILRDPRSLMILFIMPVLMIFVFGYAVRLDIQNIPLAVIDQDGTVESRTLTRSFETSDYFRIMEIFRNHKSPERIFSQRKAQAVLRIPDGFGESMTLGQPKPVQFLTDASESNTATIAAQYAEQIILIHYLSRQKEIPGIPDIRALILFNPELDSTYFIVPGLIAILFIMVCALMTSITIAREKESGTMEQILVSPVRPHEIIIGKVFPYIFLALFLGLIVIAFAMFLFEVPFEGNPLHLLLLALVYVICSLSLGILISTKARTMQIALMLALISTLLPSVMLSGFMFPISSMPILIQYITHIVPARYFLIIIRGIMLKSLGFYVLRFQILALGILTLLLLFVSIRQFKASLE